MIGWNMHRRFVIARRDNDVPVGFCASQVMAVKAWVRLTYCVDLLCGLEG